MTVGIYESILMVDDWRMGWAEENIRTHIFETVPQWGFIEYGECGRCGRWNDLWTTSINPTMYSQDVKGMCVSCLMNKIDNYCGITASRYAAYLYVNNPNTWDIEDYDKCEACSIGFPNDPNSYNQPVTAVNAGGKEYRVHARCATLCSTCDTRRLSYHSGGSVQNMVVDFYSVEHEDICQTCFDTFKSDADGDIDRCHNCATHVKSDDTYEFLGWNYCQSCYDDYCNECDECSVEYFGDTYDHTCWEDDDSPFIHNYSYKPRPFFFGEGKYHLGFELEVEARRNYPSTGAEMVCRSLGERVYCKEDGSLSHGFEIVTHPHTLFEYQKEFDWSSLDKLREEGFRSWDTETCGLHVHVSRTAFGNPNSREDVLKVQAHELRFMKLIYDNSRQVQRLAGRSESSYATFADRGKLISKVKFGNQSNGRYSAINTENDATLEVRIFRGSLKKERVLSALELVTASVEYTRDLKVAGSNKALSWLQFVSYVAQNSEQYPNLSNVLEKTFATESVSD